MLTRKDRETTKPGISILVQEKKPKIKKRSATTKNRQDKETQTGLTLLGLRLKSLQILLFYCVLFGTVAAALVVFDGPPHFPQRVWSWQEIWDKLSGPAAGVPLDFIKYLVCSLGWFMLAYIGLTFIIEVIVDLLYLFSFRFRGGRPGPIVRSLKSATALLPVSPLRRALDGLMLGAAFFAVVTTVAGGRGVDLNANGTATGGNGLGTDQDWQSPGLQAAGLVLDTFNFPDTSSQTGNASKVNDGESKLDPTFYKVSFQRSSQQLLSYHNIPASNDLPVTKNAADANNLSLASVQSNVPQQLVDVQHVVKKGDTLWSLAEHYYGDGHLYIRIYQANLNQPVGGGAHFSSAGKIYPGWVLTIPQVDSARLNPGENGTSSGKVNNSAQQESYVVQPGDSLRAIAQKLLGDESRWPQIWKLNVGQTMPDGRIANNPDLIYAGWKLRLPPHETFQPQPQPNPSTQTPGQTSPGGSVQNGNNPSNGNNTSAPDQGSSGSTSPGGNGSGSGQVVTPTQPVQPPTPATTVQPGTSTPGPVQSPVTVTPVPTQAPSTAANPTPGVATTPAISQSSATTSPATSKADSTGKTQNPTLAQNQSVEPEWAWPVVTGLGGLAVLAGLGLGLRRVGGALRNRWRKGGLTGFRRNRWQQQHEVKDWEQHNSPQIHAPIEIEINQHGEETGFAYTKRPVELLRLQSEGFDTDKPSLVLRALQQIFIDQGLPSLVPVNCIETGEHLTYLFVGSPQALTAYQKAANESLKYAKNPFSSYVKFELDSELANSNAGEEESAEADAYPAGRAKIIPFLFNRNGRKSSVTRQEQKQVEEEALQGELVEVIMSRLGGAVWIEKQREGLEITLESVELQHCYRPVAHPDHNNPDPEESLTASSEIQPDEESEAPFANRPEADNFSIKPAHRAVVEEEENNEVYQAYGALQDENEDNFYREAIQEGVVDNEEKEGEQEKLVTSRSPVIESKLQPRTFRTVRQEFIEISHENEAVLAVSHGNLSGEPAEYCDDKPGQLFFGLGAISRTGRVMARLEESEGSKWGYFNLCLETCGNLLLVSSKGDEAAQTVLLSSALQIAVGGNPDNLALYPVDRPFTLTADEIEYIPQEFGLSHQAATSLQEELRANQEVFKTLTELPQTGLVVTGDSRSELNASALTGWAANTTGLLEVLLEELVNRRAEAASEKAGSTFESKVDFSYQKLPRLVVVLSDLEAVLAIDKDGLLAQLLSEGPKWGIYTLAVASYDGLVLHNGTDSPQSQTLPVVNHFLSLGLFVAPNEESSQQLWGSSAAFELTGHGDMLFRSSARQATHLRGFCTTPEQAQDCCVLLKTLYEFRQHQNENPAGNEDATDQPLDKSKPEEAKLEVSEPSELPSPKPSQEPAIAVQTLDAASEVSLQDLQSIWEADLDEVKEDKELASSEIAAAPEPMKSSETNIVEPVSLSLQSQSPEPENSINQIKEFEAQLRSWRWQMCQEGLIQIALSIYVLHGFSLHFSLLPTYQKSKNARNGFFPFSPDPLAAYRCLMSQQLSFARLAGSGYLQDAYKLNFSMKPERTDQVMTMLLEFTRTYPNIRPGQIPKEFLVEKGFEAGEIRQALKSAQTILHKLCRIEGDNFLSQLSQGDLALLAYLALNPGKQSCFSVGQAILINKDTDRLMLKALEGRLSRVKKSLQKWFTVCIQNAFGEQEITPETILANLNFIEEHNQRETLKINEKLVYVDLWELDRLMNEHNQSSAAEQSSRIHWLEEAYWLVQATAELHNDGVEESKMKLLGVWGDNNADWTDLAGKRQRVVQRWYDLNMELGNFYQKFWRDTGSSPLTKQEDYLGQALEHYTQSALMLPTYPEPVKALINLYYLKNDLLGLDTVFTDYCASCEQIDEKPEEDIIALYNRVVRSRSKQLYLPDGSGRKKVI